MSRTVVGYIGPNGLNNMASLSPTASIEAATGLPIATGLEVGQFQEFSASEAKRFSYTVPGNPFPWGQLYDGTYMWVQLDPTVSTDPIPLGTAVSWLAGGEDGTGQTQVTTLNTTTNSDLAGFTIDSNFGKTHPYAFIQLNGKTNALFDSSGATAFGDVISLSTGTQGAVTRTGAATTQTIGLSVGVSLVTTGTASVRNLIRVNRAVARF
jgi:hypothetical protein